MEWIHIKERDLNKVKKIWHREKYFADNIHIIITGFDTFESEGVVAAVGSRLQMKILPAPLGG